MSSSSMSSAEAFGLAGEGIVVFSLLVLDWKEIYFRCSVSSGPDYCDLTVR